MINALQYDSLRTTSGSINEEISISDNDKNDFEKPSSNMDVICLKYKYKYPPTKRKVKKKKKNDLVQCDHFQTSMCLLERLL